MLTKSEREESKLSTTAARPPTCSPASADSSNLQRPSSLNPNEPIDAPLGSHNLYIGGAGAQVPGFINLDIARVPGVDVIADATHLPFPADLFHRFECDAVLQHFCHPFHE